jgi:hypothetical protein
LHGDVAWRWKSFAAGLTRSGSTNAEWRSSPRSCHCAHVFVTPFTFAKFASAPGVPPSRQKQL